MKKQNITSFADKAQKSLNKIKKRKLCRCYKIYVAALTEALRHTRYELLKVQIKMQIL